jgi:hypothetical protein
MSVGVFAVGFVVVDERSVSRFPDSSSISLDATSAATRRDHADPTALAHRLLHEGCRMHPIHFFIFAASMLAVATLGGCSQSHTEVCGSHSSPSRALCPPRIDESNPPGNREPDRTIMIPPRDAGANEASDDGAEADAEGGGDAGADAGSDAGEDAP